MADGCEREVEAQWLWHGRHVYLVDGTTVSMPDTPDNQREYPSSPEQPKGIGFPIARLVVLLYPGHRDAPGHGHGAVSRQRDGRNGAAAPLLDRFKPGDILLADRYYCSYFLIALLIASGVDFVTRVTASTPRGGFPTRPATG